jgi:serine/threonine protein kinase
VDVWSAGVIILEMLANRDNVFSSASADAELSAQLRLLGFPSEEDQAALLAACAEGDPAREAAAEMLGARRGLPLRDARQGLAELFQPHGAALQPFPGDDAAALLGGMLAFSAAKRWTVERALACAWFAPERAAHPGAVEEARARGAAAKPGLDALFEQLDRGNVDALLLGLVKRRNPAWAPPKRV